ncbi:LysE family translocator, partial [Acinetobacter ursingii]
SGIRLGVRRSARLIPAEVLGYIIAITVWGTLIDTVSATLPILPTLLKLLSAFYIIFLAVKLWKTANVQLDLNQPAIRPRELFVATLLNPKALLFASAIFPVAAWVNWSIYAVHMGVFLALIVPIALFWTFIGSSLNTPKVRWLNQRNLQRTASLILVSFSIPLSYSAL